MFSMEGFAQVGAGSLCINTQEGYAIAYAPDQWVLVFPSMDLLPGWLVKKAEGRPRGRLYTDYRILGVDENSVFSDAWRPPGENNTIPLVAGSNHIDIASPGIRHLLDNSVSTEYVDVRHLYRSGCFIPEYRKEANESSEFISMGAQQYLFWFTSGDRYREFRVDADLLTEFRQTEIFGQPFDMKIPTTAPSGYAGVPPSIRLEHPSGVVGALSCITVQPSHGSYWPGGFQYAHEGRPIVAPYSDLCWFTEADAREMVSRVSAVDLKPATWFEAAEHLSHGERRTALFISILRTYGWPESDIDKELSQRRLDQAYQSLEALVVTIHNALQDMQSAAKTLPRQEVFFQLSNQQWRVKSWISEEAELREILRTGGAGEFPDSKIQYIQGLFHEYGVRL